VLLCARSDIAGDGTRAIACASSSSDPASVAPQWSAVNLDSVEPIRSTGDAEAAVRSLHGQSGDPAQIVEIACVQISANAWRCRYRLDDGVDAEMIVGNANVLREP